MCCQGSVCGALELKPKPEEEAKDLPEDREASSPHEHRSLVRCPPRA